MGKIKPSAMMIGIAGKKQAGKTMLATRLEACGFECRSFAAPLKQLSRLLLHQLGLSLADILAAVDHKEVDIPLLGHSYRELLQTLGTDWGRTLNADIWVLCAAHHLATYNPDRVVFDDVRFENEAAFIRARDGLIIHVNRALKRRDNHASEAGIVVRDGDAVVFNNGTPKALFDQVLAILDSRFGVKL